MLLEHRLEKGPRTLHLAAAPHAGRGAEPAAKGPILVAGFGIIIGEHQLHVAGGQKMLGGASRPFAAFPKLCPLIPPRLADRDFLIDRVNFVAHPLPPHFNPPPPPHTRSPRATLPDPVRRNLFFFQPPLDAL